MYLIDNKTHTYYRQPESISDRAVWRAFPKRDVASRRLLVILASTLAVVAGPVILNTIAQGSLTSVHILFEFCRLGRVAFQIFGR
jgi:hypothetical protein